MSQPVWKTPPGSLGTIPEGVFYTIPLVASAVGSSVTYQVIAGALPAGIEINEDGILTGVANSISKIEGIAAPVPVDTISRFAVRAYSGKNIADRTFTLTVSPQNTPSFVTPAGRIATYIDGDQIFDLQVETYNPDIYAASIITLVAGALPPGLTISPQGVISGVILPNVVPGGTPGYSVEGQGYDQYPYDFNTDASSQNYQFTLQVSNGQASVLRTFSIYVYSRNTMTADNTLITADNTYITADTINQRTPVILTPAGSLGTVRSDNFFAFQFSAEDLDGAPFKFTIDSAPPGLTLDPNSGWLYGLVPASGIQITTYSFNVRVYKAQSPDIISRAYPYSLTITGTIVSDVTWISPSFLGAISNGGPSLFRIVAQNRSGIPLQYQLLSGSNSRLPQGLRLRPSGNIVGTVSFDTFALDNGATTFDRLTRLPNNAAATGNLGTETTFDLTFTFTVQVFSSNGLVNATNTFTIRVLRTFAEPFDNLYIQAMPPEQDRYLLNSLLQNNDIFPPDLLFRADDPNFGVARRVIYEHAYGLKATELDNYVQAMNLNHYWKNLTLGQIKTAQALDDAGNVIYEVVYSEIVDDLVNNNQTSVGKVVDLPYAIDVAGTTTRQVYPNSLTNMRTQIIDQIGQVSNILPRWMATKQANGQILGYQRAWVIAYTNSGASGQIAYNITSQIGNKLNLVDFEADRYELDNSQTYNWDRALQKWIPTPPTSESFDIDCHYQVTSFVGGTGYEIKTKNNPGSVNSVIRILGTQVGGVSPKNDIYITVNQVSPSGAIQGFFMSGIAPFGSAGSTWTGITGTTIVGTGSNAVFNLEAVPGIATTFDGGSVQFSAPSTQFNDGTTDYDKYLVFPKRDILQ